MPGTYVRDYRSNRGWLTVCRGYRTMYDHFRDTDKLTAALPAETLACFPRGNVTAASLYRGAELMRPGWRLEMRKLRSFITRQQADRIERQLHHRVFT